MEQCPVTLVAMISIGYVPLSLFPCDLEDLRAIRTLRSSISCRNLVSSVYLLFVDNYQTFLLLYFLIYIHPTFTLPLVYNVPTTTVQEILYL